VLDDICCRNEDDVIMCSWYFKHWFLFMLLPDYDLLPVQIGILKYVWPTSVRGSRSESRLTSASGLISGPCIRYVVQMCRWVLCTGLPWLLLVTVIVWAAPIPTPQWRTHHWSHQEPRTITQLNVNASQWTIALAKAKWMHRM